MDRFIVLSTASVKDALQQIESNKHKFVLAVDEHRRVVNVFTDGDFRRWLLSQQQVDLETSLSHVEQGRPFLFARQDDDISKIEKLFSESIAFVPIVDSQKHLIAIARKRSEGDPFLIGPFSLNESSPTFFIAEVGINHNGSMDLARKLIDVSVVSGADCVKFQMRNLESLLRKTNGDTSAQEDLGAQYTHDLLKRFQLSNEEMASLFDYAKSKQIFPLVTPWDGESLDFCERYGMEGYKVASADFTNHALLETLALTGKPLICSTGMCSETEIEDTVALLRRLGVSYSLLHCNSTYPTPYKDVNLKYLPRLQELGRCIVGYSGHERGWHAPLAAIALGAKIIEKHITVDKGLEGNDHKVSLLPGEFREMVMLARDIEQSLGLNRPRSVSQGEMMNRVTLAKSLVASRDIEFGQLISPELVEVKSPGRGLQPNRLKELIGRRAARVIKQGEFFYASDLGFSVAVSKDYHFGRPWGVPVRYHDYKSLLSQSNPDFLEFHLSYKDMELDPTAFFGEPFPNLGLVVHSPDLFAGDHLLNLADDDEEYRQTSIRELQAVVNLTRRLKQWFPSTPKPLIVASLGGYTRDRLLNEEEKVLAYERLHKSLQSIDAEGVEIIAQTLPPFPWYFGGQLFLSLFMNPNDTAEFCERAGLRLCFDVSHSKLACNYFNWSFSSFVRSIGKHVAHLHLGDASGVDEEGLQIGKGDIDFRELGEQLQDLSPKSSFIPEIWQGHKNDGEGFWEALNLLEGVFS